MQIRPESYERGRLSTLNSVELVHLPVQGKTQQFARIGEIQLIIQQAMCN